jgi:hypothetical protein
MVHIRKVMCAEHLQETMVKISNCNVTSNLIRPIEAEIDTAITDLWQGRNFASKSGV